MSSKRKIPQNLSGSAGVTAPSSAGDNSLEVSVRMWFGEFTLVNVCLSNNGPWPAKVIWNWVHFSCFVLVFPGAKECSCKRVFCAAWGLLCTSCRQCCRDCVLLHLYQQAGIHSTCRLSKYHNHRIIEYLKLDGTHIESSSLLLAGQIAYWWHYYFQCLFNCLSCSHWFFSWSESCISFSLFSHLYPWRKVSAVL